MKFSRYEDYKLASSRFFNEVPSHWGVLPLKRTARLEYGDALPAEDRAENGEVPVFGSNGPFARHDNPNTRGPVIVVGRKGSFGKVVYSRPPVFAVDTTFFIDERHTGSWLRWLYYALQVIRLDSVSADTGVPGLSRESAYSELIPVPTSREQFQIATFLDYETARIDRLIEKQQRLIELLQEKRQAVISHAVTKGLNPDVPMKNSGIEWLGEVPAHWQTTRVGRLYREVSRKGESSLPILSVSIHYGVTDREIMPEESDRKLQRMADKESYKLVRAGDLVYNMMRAWQGAIGAAKVDGLVSPAYVVATPREDLCSEYFQAVLRTPSCVEEMRRYSKGITDFRLRTYWDDFRNVIVPLPPVKEQRSIMNTIGERLASVSDLVTKTEASVELLQEHRTTLISAAVTGKINVRDWRPPESLSEAEERDGQLLQAAEERSTYG